MKAPETAAPLLPQRRRGSASRPLARRLRPGFAALILFGVVVACGRSELLAVGSEGSTGGAGGAGGAMPCEPGEVMVCGTDVGVCSTGERYCEDGFFGECQGAIGPFDEECNGLDDDCDGLIDNVFNLGHACDGPDSDQCNDDIITCDGCSTGDDNLEICNGLDDNCNGIFDADCDVGDCQPELLVTGSTPSSPSCIDFPVEAGSTGSIQYPCAGGAVSAVLGGIPFTGSVTDGQVSLSGTQLNIGPDGCQWKMDHYIEGWIPSGTLEYAYFETLLDSWPWCWSPCTEVGTVEIQW